jgi:hypothetical protein
MHRLKDLWDGFVQNQSGLPMFFSPRKVNLKIGLEDTLPRIAKSWKMTYPD